MTDLDYYKTTHTVFWSQSSVNKAFEGQLTDCFKNHLNIYPKIIISC